MKEMGFEPIDIAKIEQNHRDIMLDLILAWGTLDGAIGILAANFHNMTLTEYAEKHGKTNCSKKLQQIYKIVRENTNGNNIASRVKKIKEIYEKHSKCRNFVAHSHCKGVWTKDPDYIVFQTFEKTEGDCLAINLVPLEEMQRATKWGKDLTDWVHKIT